MKNFPSTQVKAVIYGGIILAVGYYIICMFKEHAIYDPAGQKIGTRKTFWGKAPDSITTKAGAGADA